MVSEEEHLHYLLWELRLQHLKTEGMTAPCTHPPHVFTALYCHFGLPGTCWFLRKPCSRNWVSGDSTGSWEKHRRRKTSTQLSVVALNRETQKIFGVQTVWCYNLAFYLLLELQPFNLWSHEFNQRNQKKIFFCKMSLQTVECWIS